MFHEYSLNQGQYHRAPLSLSPQLSACPAPITKNRLRRNRKADKDIHLNRCSISPDCVSKFNELKLNKKIKYIIYKLTDDYKEIVVEETSEDGDWEAFREKLVNAQSKSKTVCNVTQSGGAVANT